MGPPEDSDCVHGSASGYAVSFIGGVLHQQIWLHEYEICRILCWAGLLRKQLRVLLLVALSVLAQLLQLR